MQSIKDQRIFDLNKVYLNLARADYQKAVMQQERYVRIALDYGLDRATIAAEVGLDLARVDAIVSGE